MKEIRRVCAFIICVITAFSFIFTSATQAANNRDGIIYWHGDENNNKIALTFDDGPNEPYTSQVLDTLKAFNVKATFFVIGKYVDDFPEITKRIVREGHAIGNHTYDHLELRFEPKRVIINQTKRAEDAILKATARRPYLFRPPYGASEPKIVNEVRKMGYVTIEYSVSGRDGGKPRIKSDAIVKNVLSRTKNGSIILLHDGDRFVKEANRSHSVKALSVIIRSLREKGYRFVTVPQLLGLKNGR